MRVACLGRVFTGLINGIDMVLLVERSETVRVTVVMRSILRENIKMVREIEKGMLNLHSN